MEKPSTGNRSEWVASLKCVGFASGIGCLFICGVFFLSHLVINNMGISYRGIHMLVISVGIAGAFLAGYVAARMRRKKGLFLGASCGAVMFCVMLLSNLMVSGDGMGAKALLKLVTMLIASALGGVLGVNKRTRRKTP